MCACRDLLYIMSAKSKTDNRQKSFAYNHMGFGYIFAINSYD